MLLCTIDTPQLLMGAAELTFDRLATGEGTFVLSPPVGSRAKGALRGLPKALARGVSVLAAERAQGAAGGPRCLARLNGLAPHSNPVRPETMERCPGIPSVGVVGARYLERDVPPASHLVRK